MPSFHELSRTHLERPSINMTDVWSGDQSPINNKFLSIPPGLGEIEHRKLAIRPDPLLARTKSQFQIGGENGSGNARLALSGINVQTHNNYIMLQFNTVCADPYNMIMLLV